MAEKENFVGRSARAMATALALIATALPILPGQQGARKTSPRPANPTLARARRRVLSARSVALYYYSGDTRGLESILAHASAMTLLAPQCYWVETDGVIRGELPPRVAEISERTHLPVMPLLYNKGFDRETVTRLLRDRQAQRRAASYMAYLAARDNTTGFQLDLENIAPADQALFTRFVRLAAERLHGDGRLLSVAVVPRFTDDPPGPARPGQPLTGEWSAAYDYRALGRIADFLTVMTYEHSNSSSPPGPIAGFDWVKRALEFAAERVPGKKLLLGIPLYGREWAETEQGTTTRSLTSQDVREILARPEVQARWDEQWRSPWFQYRDAGTVRTVWYEDPRSWTEKLGLVREYHLRGFAAWRLGFEDSEFWSLPEVASGGRASASSASH